MKKYSIAWYKKYWDEVIIGYDERWGLITVWNALDVFYLENHRKNVSKKELKKWVMTKMN